MALMSSDKYQNIFSRQTETIVYIYPTRARRVIVKSKEAYWLKALQLNVPVVHTHYQSFNSLILY